jgi:hypothetical protein
MWDQRYVVLSDLRINGTTRAIEETPMKFSLDTVDDLTPQTADINYCASSQKTFMILCAKTTKNPMMLRIFTAKLGDDYFNITVHMEGSLGVAECGPSIAKID